MIPIPEKTHDVPQPVEAVDVIDDILFRTIFLENEGDAIDQHKHEVDHVTLLMNGSARLWVNERHVGDYKAFSHVKVVAGDDHIWQALEPNTRLSCMFNTGTPEFKHFDEKAGG